jgi:DDE family transposase
VGIFLPASDELFV